MGGRTEFFGPVVREPNEPVFHARWEGRVFGMALFSVILFGRNIDAFRFAQERLPREVYLSGYYRRWLAGLESQLVRAGYLGPDEVDARVAGRASLTDLRRTSRMRVAVTARMMSFLLRPRFPRWFATRALPRLVGTSRPALRGARFAVDDHVRVRDHRTAGPHPATGLRDRQARCCCSTSRLDRFPRCPCSRQARSATASVHRLVRRR
jgi:hypothetical protein